MKLDIETDKFCSALLTEISILNSHLSKKITNRVKNNIELKNDKRKRKLAKVAIYYVEHNTLYEAAANTIRNKPEFKHLPQDPTISTIYNSIYKLVSNKAVIGSVESKDEKKY